MLSQSLDGLQQKLWEKLKIPAAYGPVLRKFQSAIIFVGVHPNFVTTLATMVNLNAC